MMTRLAEIGIILLVLAWSLGVAASAGTATIAPTPTPAGTSSDLVITDDIPAYSGPLGPDSPLFGLKLAMENLDEAFTLNASEKVMKQMKHAELRISEIRGMLLMNNPVKAEGALDAYFEKVNLTDVELSAIPVRTSGIATAYGQHLKHELALWDLLQENPDNTELRRAYNRTLTLEQGFREKSTIRIEKRLTQLNRITARVYRVENRTEDAGEIRGSATGTSVPDTEDHGKGKAKQVERDQGTAPPVTETTSPARDDTSGKNKGKGKGGEGQG